MHIAGVDDAPAIAGLRALWTNVPCAPDFQRRLREWLEAEGDRRTTWLARAQGQPIGMASLFEYRRMPRPGRDDSRWGYLSNMFVREEFRNQRVGSALLAAIIATAEERGYARVVLSPSENALSFYKRAGFALPDESAKGDLLLLWTPAAPGLLS